MCTNDEPVDEFVLYGDAAWLLAYGAIQGIVDIVLGPMASADPSMFTNDIPLERYFRCVSTLDLPDACRAHWSSVRALAWYSPVAQGSLLALTWILLTRATGGYAFSKTRELPNALFYAATSWLASCALLIGGLALLGSMGVGPGASPAEVAFITGSATIVGGWRLVCASLPSS